MSTTDSQPIDRPSQFQLRHAGVIVVVMAITLAIAAPWLRQWTFTEWLAMLRYFGYMAIGVAIYLLLFERRHLAVRRQSGPVLISIRPATGKFRELFHYFLAASMIAIVLVLGLMQVKLQHAPPTNLYFWFLMNCLIPIQMSFNACSQFRAFNQTRLCDNGLVIYSFMFIPWEQLQRWNWGSVDPNKLLFYSKNMQVATIQVSRDQRDEIDAILRVKTASNDAKD
ncbi:DUF5673 domain-containing protein [Blastopirellula retiformator]|uniref:DUF5673 domain-containing protein n=1 Tax=Blastopirellula retiformator TaxID=2527970 RepID=A0A5C5VNF3_9BACT|nr:DUF5673 domain-containing protein [Blastopirellula retiformator]TWT39550.1 hypothetical protein Enr8_12500 [Blastopirellula retiformator]